VRGVAEKKTARPKGGSNENCGVGVGTGRKRRVQGAAWAREALKKPQRKRHRTKEERGKEESSIHRLGYCTGCVVAKGLKKFWSRYGDKVECCALRAVRREDREKQQRIDG